MLSEKQISALCASFPQEALSADVSRGFELTSIKAAFVVERLNQVFGPCGAGWRYVHAPFEWMEGEVITEVALQFQVTECGGSAVVWDSQSHGWAFVPDSTGWSWPILSPGGRRPGKGTAPLTDARKGAVTDGLTKAASMIGVGHEVFKGLVRVAQPARSSEGAQTPRQSQQPRITAPALQQPPSASHAVQQSSSASHAVQRPPSAPHAVQQSSSALHTAQQPPVDAGTRLPAPGVPAGYQNDNGRNGVGHHPADPGTGFRKGGSNGAARTQAGAGTGLPAPGVPAGFRANGGNGATAAVVKANATTYWLKANDHADKLDRAQVSALAKQVIDGQLSWQEAQSRLDDWIDTAVLPSFNVANGATVKTPVAASAKSMTEHASDPLDELFE